jgi:hypothetical protein
MPSVVVAAEVASWVVVVAADLDEVAKVVAVVAVLVFLLTMVVAVVGGEAATRVGKLIETESSCPTRESCLRQNLLILDVVVVVVVVEFVALIHDRDPCRGLCLSPAETFKRFQKIAFLENFFQNVNKNVNFL